MAGDMNKEDILRLLKSGEKLSIANQFSILQEISRFLNYEDKLPSARELVLRCLEWYDRFSDTKDMLNSIVRELGYYPYLPQVELGLNDAIAYEFHRPEKLNDFMPEVDFVFHQQQHLVYQKIRSGKNVVLSAPTSFGKSKIIDAIIADGKYKNIVIVVPTLALIDETRRRLSRLFSGSYCVISHPSQGISDDKNIFILTPERVISLKDKLTSIDFFVIDEFYKISNNGSDDDKRVVALNEAFYYLFKKHHAQFYMLGPNIQHISSGAQGFFNFEFISTDFNTVITDQIRIHISNDEERTKKLVALCKRIEGQTIIYCKSPGQVYEVTAALIQKGVRGQCINVDSVSDWMSTEFHPDWVLAQGIKLGIGIHVGPLPRSIAQDMVRLFNEERIQFLVCTSTIIEGVNTKAKNVIVFENKIAKKKLDYFTFNNIKGRSGRMFEHFIGRVYVFDDDPQLELPLVDFPLYSQNEETPESLLIQMDEEDLSDSSLKRVEPFMMDSILPVWIIKENHGIPPQEQIDICEHIQDNIDTLYNDLAWSGYPNYQQLKATCELIWSFWVGNSKHGVFSGSQLAVKLNQLSRKESYRQRIENELSPGKYAAKDANEAVERVLGFDRNWAGFEFPQLLMALHRIQKYIFESEHLKAGDYSFYAKKVESLFLPEVCVALDEFGIPVNFSQKYPHLTDGDSLGKSLSKIKRIDFTHTNIHPYEKELMINAQQDIAKL